MSGTRDDDLERRVRRAKKRAYYEAKNRELAELRAEVERLREAR